MAVSATGLPAWNLRTTSFTAGKMPAAQDRLEAYPPDFSDMLSEPLSELVFSDLSLSEFRGTQCFSGQNAHRFSKHEKLYRHQDPEDSDEDHCESDPGGCAADAEARTAGEAFVIRGAGGLVQHGERQSRRHQAAGWIDGITLAVG
jgi:hypothetical protein